MLGCPGLDAISLLALSDWDKLKLQHLLSLQEQYAEKTSQGQQACLMPLSPGFVIDVSFTTLTRDCNNGCFE